MTRMSVRAAFGLAALLIAPTLVMAQVARDPGSARGEGQPSRAFRGISFSPARLAPVWGTRPVSTLPPRPMDVYLGAAGGGRLPGVTATPQPHPAPPPCVMRVIPIDPRLAPRMLIVPGNASIDPKSVVKLPPCQAHS